MAEYDAALEINPNFHAAYSGKGVALILSGRAGEALSPIELALRISPRDPFAFFWHGDPCEAHLHLREYKEAIEEYRRSMNLNNSYLHAYVDLISAYGTTGQMEQARQALAELSKKHPNFTVQGYRQVAYAFSSNLQYRRETDDIVDGLKKGGVSEQ